MNIIQDIQNAYLPELILILFIVINVFFAIFIKKHTYKISKIITAIALILSGLSMFFIQIEPNYYAFNNVFVSNTYTTALKIMILVSATLILISSDNFIREKRFKSFEFFAIFLSGILGAFSLISSNEFISAFISIELLGIACYFLSGFRRNHKSKEASLKYVITGASSSAWFLFGISYIYGLTGNTNFSMINDIFSNYYPNLLFVFACTLIICSLMFKIGCIPFNNWIIDVYTGSTYSVCCYLSLIPKIAAIGFITKLFALIFSFSPVLQVITAFIALISIIYASIGAIKQTNIKKIYAYSSIIHSGFLLIATTVLNVYSISTVIFYIITYIFMNIGIWIASIIFTTEYVTDEISDYKGLFYKRPYFTLALSTCLLSLAGLPITGGFVAKLYLFSSFLRTNFMYTLILVLTLIATVICIFVYFKIIKELFSTSKNGFELINKSIMPKATLYLCALITIIIGFFPNEIVKLSQIIAYYL